MTIRLTGKNLTLEDVERVARHDERVELSEDALARMKACRAFLEERIGAGEMMYGVNTGIGEFSEIRLSDDKVRDFQRNLIYNHAAGIGDPIPVEQVRAAMLLRANVHANGYSAARPVITQTYVEMLNRGVTPLVCERGSVGASGDLAPMSQIALLLLGEGEAYYQGERLPGAVAMERAGITPPGLEARDGLASINGSNMICAISSLIALDAERALAQAEIAAAMSLEALRANLKPYDSKLHELRGFPGSVRSAENIRKMIEGSDLRKPGAPVRVQDAYSMRSTPQVIGAARDQLRWTRIQLEQEINGVGDNPIFLADEQRILTGANFQGTPISVPVDHLGGVLAMVSVLSERRFNRLTNPALSAGLPAFLASDPGFYSGLMLSQYTADMQIVEQKMLATPAYFQSIPAAADQEDFVSMGMNSAMKTRKILELMHGVVGIELMAAAQALDFRDYTPGVGTRAAHAEVRRHVPFLDVDRPLYPDHNAIRRAASEWRILHAVEAAVGPLTPSWDL